MRRIYENPPIIEGACEFRFKQDSAWDITIPGLLYEKLRDVFPEKHQSVIANAEVSPKESKNRQDLKALPRMLFSNVDNTASVQVGPNYLSIRHFTPYPTWIVFKPLIERVLSDYLNVAIPTGFERIGLRYINKFVFPVNSIKIEEYFNFYPEVGNGLPQAFFHFIAGIHYLYEENRDLMRVQISSGIPENIDELNVMLDLDYYMAQPETVSIDEVSDWIEVAHAHIGEVFEGCINQPLRDMLTEVKNEYHDC